MKSPTATDGLVPFKMNVEHWREKLSALDFERECTEPFSEDSCWLCDDLEAWNTVLHPLQLTLTEQRQGVLCLSSEYYETTPDFDVLDTPYDSTFFTVWLPKKHLCIQQLGLTPDFPDFNAVTIPDNATSPPNLQRISIYKNASFDWAELLNALGPIEQLEELEINDVDVSDSLASTIARLVFDSAHCIKVFHLGDFYMHCSTANILMSNIPKCEELKELTFDANLSSAGMRDFRTLLQSTETLEKLCLSVYPNWGIDPTMEVDHNENNEKLLSAVGDLLRRNTTLTELRYRGELGLVTDILNALETNTALSCLTLDVDMDSTDHGHTIGTALMSMLARNKGLCSLVIEDVVIDYGVAGPMSEGLKQNTTLECLDLSESTVTFSAHHALCNALSRNRTLRALKIGSCEAQDAESKSLAADVARMQCYGCLQMQWNHWYVPGLSSALLEPLLCPPKLFLDTSLFSDDSFSAICKAVALSIHLKELEVHFRAANSARVNSLCEALRENKSLKCITLYEDFHSPGSAATAAQSLSFNKSVTQLEVHCKEVDETSADMFASLLMTNESIWKFEIKSRVRPTPACVHVLNRALVENQFITCGGLYVLFKIDSSFGSLGAALQRNLARLRMAARFVLRKNMGKMFAEAFEHFRSKEQLLRCVQAASDMSESEARTAERAAELFVRKNYLVINRVVRYKVECHPGRGTQIDQLTYDCWLAIAKYLKVSDVV